jgi:hypothetical protein
MASFQMRSSEEVGWRVFEAAVAFLAGLFCFFMGALHHTSSPEIPIPQYGFHLPDQEPAKGISEGRPPYCICLQKENGMWKWLVYKHGDDTHPIGGGATESYLLSRNLSLTYVDEDRKVCRGLTGSR